MNRYTDKEVPTAVQKVAAVARKSATDAGMDEATAAERVYVSCEKDYPLRVAYGPDGVKKFPRLWTVVDNWESVQLLLRYDGSDWYAKHMWSEEPSRKISQAEAEENARLFFHG